MVKIIRMPLEKTSSKNKITQLKGFGTSVSFGKSVSEKCFLEKIQLSWYASLYFDLCLHIHLFIHQKNLQMCWKSYWSEYDYIHIKTNNLGCTSYIIHTNNSSNNSQNNVNCKKHIICRTEYYTRLTRHLTLRLIMYKTKLIKDRGINCI